MCLIEQRHARRAFSCATHNIAAAAAANERVRRSLLANEIVLIYFSPTVRRLIFGPRSAALHNSGSL